MKKAISIVLALAMVFALAACAGGGTTTTDPTPAPPTTDPTPGVSAPVVDLPDGDLAWNPDNIREQTFILAHGMAETSQVGMQYHQFALAVEALSEGKMIVQERIAGTLVADTETLDAIMDDTIDFAHSMGSFVSGTISDISPLTIAGYYGGDNWLGFAEDTHGIISDIYAEYGIKYMGALYQGNSVIVCTERQVQVPADVSGLAFRASGTWVARTVQAWGGAATTIGLADLSDAFSKKTVQGTATGLNIVVPFKIYEVAEYITFTTISEGFAALIMSGTRWEKLNEDEQALLTEAAKIFVQNAHDLALELSVDYVATIENAGLNEIYYLSDEEQIEFVDLAQALYVDMASEVGDKGNELIRILQEING